MNNHAFVPIPPPGVPPSYPNQDFFSGTINQTPAMLQYSDQTLEPGYSRNLLPERTGPCGSIYRGRIVTILRGEPKVVGAIQILIGLVHIGFGSVLTRLVGVYMAAIVISGYVYWGGILFELMFYSNARITSSCVTQYIISGSVMVAAEHHKTARLVKGSLGMNITSSFTATVGIIIFLLDNIFLHGYYVNKPYPVEWRVAQGLENVLLIFSILEFFLGIASSSFGCEAICHEADAATHFVPDGFVAQGVLLPADNPPPYEAYTNLGYESENQPE
ncbi:membrane-spanning 4-domains subfamily A member 15-like [Tiliqua scincoides]|uniref:membrane-spanning 4-domains subfamily A member 15-like n=1 Tax=Tiliqua scincoides TaxID=71010 RepID=UPI003462C14F